MFRDQVLEHYRVRGYKLHERVKVRGRSGSVHACDLVAQGPLGNLIVMLGDDHDIEGPELTSFRRSAKDIGAAAVLAMEHPEPAVRETARMLGVKVIDEQALADGEPLVATPPPAEVEDHPWPEQEVRMRKVQRSRTEEGAGKTATALWKHPRSTGRPAKDESSFAWLKPKDGDEPTAERPGERPSARAPTAAPRAAPAAAGGAGPAGPTVSAAMPGAAPKVAARDETAPPALRSVRSDAPARFAWHWVWGPTLYGVVTALLLLFAWFLFVKNA